MSRTATRTGLALLSASWLGCAPRQTVPVTNVVVCGDDRRQAPEVCDGTDLAGESCTTQGFADGTLTCLSTCDGFDTTACPPAPFCGDDHLDDGELCDSEALGTADCLGLGFAGGQLACATDCLAFVTDACRCDADGQCSPGFCNTETGLCHANDEDCGDTTDNDDDAAIDCADLDCAGRAVCLPPPCPDADLGNALGADRYSGDTSGEADETTPSCNPGGAAPDLQFSWTAPLTGRFLFAVDSPYDAVLYLLDGGCGGAELACVDREGGHARELLVFDLDVDQTVAVIVDGYNGRAGTFTLDITRSERGLCDNGADDDEDGDADCADPECLRDSACEICPAGDLGSAVGLALATADTHDGIDDNAVSCDAHGASPNLEYLWTVPSDGDYRISIEFPGWDGVFAVLDGTCGGNQVICVDDGGVGDTEEWISTLTAGQTYTIVVDGYGTTAGVFTVNIETQ